MECDGNKTLDTNLVGDHEPGLTRTHLVQGEVLST
jgi:hypothetical protein